MMDCYITKGIEPAIGREWDMAEEQITEVQPAASQEGNGAAQQTQAPTVRWDDSKMQSTYANACNVISTREEIVLFFGLNQGLRGGEAITVDLSERVILNPYAAKRLNLLLTNVLREHEARLWRHQYRDATLDSPRLRRAAAVSHLNIP